MRLLRQQLINIYAVIGIISVAAALVLMTGYLLHIITPRLITTWIAYGSASIDRQGFAYALFTLAGWGFAILSTSIIYKYKSHPPIQIKEDNIGIVEISTDALCSIARNEARNQGISGSCRADFTRKLGSPMLQLWCDLTSGSGDGPVALGDKLKKDIEKRLREDFNLTGIRVSVIHQPRSNGVRR